MNTFIMFIPVGNSISVCTSPLQNCLPEFFNRIIFSEAGKNFFCPFDTGHRGNTPLMFIFNFVTERLDKFQTGTQCTGIFFLVHSVHTVGIIGIKPQTCGKLFRHPLPPCRFPRHENGQIFLGLEILCHFINFHIHPVENNSACSGKITLFDNSPYKIKLLKVCT